LKSLVKNIFISIVALTLLISITGFQVYKHTCAFHNFSAVSVIETPICEKDHQVIEKTDDCCKIEEEIIQSNCCDSEPITKSDLIVITSQELSCCTSSIESNQLESSLFPPVEQKISLIENYFVVISLNIIELQNSIPVIVLNNKDLPPPVFGKQLLQSIHQLKIDTPIC
jgi:hypothetical protein